MCAQYVSIVILKYYDNADNKIIYILSNNKTVFLTYSKGLLPSVVQTDYRMCAVQRAVPNDFRQVSRSSKMQGSALGGERCGAILRLPSGGTQEALCR